MAGPFDDKVWNSEDAWQKDMLRRTAVVDDAFNAANNRFNGKSVWACRNALLNQVIKPMCRYKRFPGRLVVSLWEMLMEMSLGNDLDITWVKLQTIQLHADRIIAANDVFGSVVKKKSNDLEEFYEEIETE